VLVIVSASEAENALKRAAKIANREGNRGK
jgi:hypothetical protein